MFTNPKLSHWTNSDENTSLWIAAASENFSLNFFSLAVILSHYSQSDRPIIEEKVNKDFTYVAVIIGIVSPLRRVRWMSTWGRSITSGAKRPRMPTSLQQRIQRGRADGWRIWPRTSSRWQRFLSNWRITIRRIRLTCGWPTSIWRGWRPCGRWRRTRRS